MSHLNTLRSTIGFFRTLVTRYTPFDLSTPSIDGIFNFVRIDERWITSGQPTEEQLALVAEEGYRHVINLAPHGGENALPDEAATLDSLGVRYVHIPVDWQRPTEEDFDAFCRAMAEISPAPVLVHCAANMRVSAFSYRYRTEVLDHDPVEARRDLERLWQPFGVWKEFVDGQAAGRSGP